MLTVTTKSNRDSSSPIKNQQIVPLNHFVSPIYMTIGKTWKSRNLQYLKENALTARVLGSQIKSRWLAPRLTQPFNLLQLIKSVPGFPGDLVVKNRMSHYCDSADLGQLKTIH